MTDTGNWKIYLTVEKCLLPQKICCDILPTQYTYQIMLLKTFSTFFFGRIGESGFYVLAKFNDEEKSEIEITAFQVRS